MLRNAAALMAVLWLGACSVVGSDAPLFAAADRTGAPVLRPGLWAAPAKGCRFSSKASAEKWPDCANGAVVGPQSLLGGRRDATGAFTEVLPYLLAGGDPAVMQIETPPGHDLKGPRFVYVGVRPLASDETGAIVKTRLWLALCAPPAAAGAPATPPPKLPAGVTPSRGYCVTKSKPALRTMVRVSEGWAFRGAPDDYGLVAFWVRDEPR